MLPAELAVFVHLNPFRIVPLVLLSYIVAALAFCTSQCYFHSHDRHLLLVILLPYAEAGSSFSGTSESFASLSTAGTYSHKKTGRPTRICAKK